MLVGLHTDPSDVLWEQLTIPFYSRVVRTIAINAVLALLIVLWVFPVAAVQSLANIQTLAQVEYLTWIQCTSIPPPLPMRLVATKATQIFF